MVEKDELKREEQEIAERADKKDEEDQVAKNEGNETEQESEQYGAVVEAMASILGESPAFEAPDFLSPEIADALEELYAAKTAVRESIGDGTVAGLQRMKSLNLALAKLRPVLSVGLSPGKDDETREEIGEAISELRHEIKQTIYKEAVPPLRAEKKDEEDDTGDEDDPDDDEDA